MIPVVSLLILLQEISPLWNQVAIKTFFICSVVDKMTSEDNDKVYFQMMYLNWCFDSI